MAASHHQGDGHKLWEKTHVPFGLVPRRGPAFAPQMAGWFRKKINTVGDFKGLPDDVRAWLGRGAHAINMETAPLYAAAAACGVRSLWLGHISDTLSLNRQEWESWQRPAAMTDVSVSLMVGLLEPIGPAGV
jgi:hypothetical protein